MSFAKGMLGMYQPGGGGGGDDREFFQKFNDFMGGAGKATASGLLEGGSLMAAQQAGPMRPQGIRIGGVGRGGVPVSIAPSHGSQIISQILARAGTR